VLSTKIFFAVVGAAHDQAQAAVLSTILSASRSSPSGCNTLWLGKRVYTTVPEKVIRTAAAAAAPPRPGSARYRHSMGDFLFVDTPIILVAALFALWRTTRPRSNTMPRLPHRNNAARFILLGLSVDSFFATLEVATISAPLTATIGLLTAYLLTRQRFACQRLSNHHDAELRNPPGTRRRHQLYPCLQRAAPSRSPAQVFILIIYFCLPQYAGGCTFRHRHHEPDRQSLDEASSPSEHDPSHAATGGPPLLRPASSLRLFYSFVAR